jgi:hypothetical protein
MKPMIYRPKRWRGGKLTVAQMWRGRFRVGVEKLSRSMLHRAFNGE